jgi:hypothetical protein
LPTLIIVAASAAAATLLVAGAPPDKWQAPPGDESASVHALIDAAQKALEGGRSASAVLADPTYDDVRSYPRFREIIRAHAPVGEVTMISPGEPGEWLTLTFKLGKAGQTIYAYHTDARGAYGKSGVHFQANSGDYHYARLFTYIKTGADGSATLHTIRPIGYPQGELPQHVHFHVEPGRASVGEFWFSDDPRLTPTMREHGKGEALIVTPVKTKDGWTATATIELQER